MHFDAHRTNGLVMVQLGPVRLHCVAGCGHSWCIQCNTKDWDDVEIEAKNEFVLNTRAAPLKFQSDRPLFFQSYHSQRGMKRRKRSPKVSQRMRRRSSKRGSKRITKRRFRSSETLRFVDTYVPHLKKLQKEAMRYENIYILTMNNMFQQVKDVCEQVLDVPKPIVVYHRESFTEAVPDSIPTPSNDYDATIVKKLLKIKSILTAHPDKRVYFVDDSFEEGRVEQWAKLLGIDDRLKYKKVKYEGDGIKLHQTCEHITYHNGYDVWCMDFDGTITDFIQQEPQIRDRKQYVNYLKEVDEQKAYEAFLDFRT